MKRKNIPPSYFRDLRTGGTAEWSQVLHKLGIRFWLTKRGGSRYRSKCVFHQEKTPSLLFNPFHGTYHCFGCGESGDIFTFVAKVLNGDAYGKNKVARTCRWFKKCFDIPLPWE